MAGGSTSEEMDAFDDVTPPKAVSIYDLDEDLPTRAQSSDEIAEFQRLAREKKAGAFRSFGPPKRDGISSPPDESPASGRPIPRESGPVRIQTPPSPAPASPPAPLPAIVAEPADQPDLDVMLQDLAAGLERLPPAPRVPHFEEMRGTLETIHGAEPRPPARRRRWLQALRGIAFLSLSVLAAVAAYVLASR